MLYWRVELNDISFTEDMLFKSEEAAYAYLSEQSEVQQYMEEMEYASVEEIFADGNMILLDMYLHDPAE
jgi:hypothetical protein